MQSRGTLVATAAIAVVVLGFGAIYALRGRQSLSSSDSGLYPGLHGQIAPECPGKTLTTQGFSAILARNDCTPSFTARDVRDYLARGFSMRNLEQLPKS